MARPTIKAVITRDERFIEILQGWAAARMAAAPSSALAYERMSRIGIFLPLAVHKAVMRTARSSAARAAAVAAATRKSIETQRRKAIRPAGLARSNGAKRARRGRSGPRRGGGAG